VTERAANSKGKREGAIDKMDEDRIETVKIRYTTRRISPGDGVTTGREKDRQGSQKNANGGRLVLGPGAAVEIEVSTVW
jgi:hypothetical protein